MDAGPESNKPEVGCSILTGAAITSGGGFSIANSRPAWQRDAVQSSLLHQPYNSNTTPSTMTQAQFSEYSAMTDGRAYPDVSLLGHNYVVVLNGKKAYLDGTAASAPVFAAMGRLHNELLTIGMCPRSKITTTL